MGRGIILFSFALLIVGCKTPAELTGAYDISSESIIYRDRVEYVEVPADSGIVQALLECDEAGKVVMKELDMVSSENSRLKFSLDSLGSIKARYGRPAVYIPVEVHDTTIVRSDTLRVYETVYVDKPLTWWQKTKMDFGGVAIGALMIFVAYIIYSLYKKLKK